MQGKYWTKQKGECKITVSEKKQIYPPETGSPAARKVRAGPFRKKVFER